MEEKTVQDVELISHRIASDFHDDDSISSHNKKLNPRNCARLGEKIKEINLQIGIELLREANSECTLA